MNFFVLFLLLMSFSYAQTSPPVSPVENKIDEIQKEITSTKENRENSFGTLMVGYQLVTSWLPSKKVLSYTQIFNEAWSLEAEYSWSSVDDPLFWIDIGEVREKRFNLQARRYLGNSFNFSFGGVYSQFRARLGSDFLDNFGREIRSSFDAHNIGITGGIGNRWQWSNGLTIGVDWLRLNMPVFETYVRDDVIDSISNADEQEDIKNVIRSFNRIPTFVLLGVSLGYSF